MKKTYAFLLISTLLMILLCAAGCSSGMNDMFDSYNGNFTSGALIKGNNPGSGNFDPSLMLLPNYAIRDDSSISLSGPPNCVSYSWKLYTRDEHLATQQGDPNMSHYNTRVAMRNVTDDAQYFCIHIPDTGLALGTYKLVLTCVYKNNEKTFTYEDYCSLVIFKAIGN